MSVTMDDVAARAGVSRAAVSMALRNSPKVSAARREQILQVAAELGYRPNINASRLARTRTGTIGVVFSDLHNALYAEMLDGLDAALRGEPEQLLLASGFHDPDRERAAVEAFLAHRVDGLALLGSQLSASEIQQLASEVPTVIAGRRVEGVDWVTVDDAISAALATEHLIALGHRRIAHIDGGHGAGAALRREQFLRDDARAPLGAPGSRRGRGLHRRPRTHVRPGTAVSTTAAKRHLRRQRCIRPWCPLRGALARDRGSRISLRGRLRQHHHRAVRLRRPLDGRLRAPPDRRTNARTAEGTNCRFE